MQTLTNQLETMTDHYSIEAVLIALSEICGQKSEHIAHSWQDVSLAKRWAALEGAIDVIVPRARGL